MPDHALDPVISAQHPPLVTARREIVNDDPCGKAGRTAGTGWTVKDVLRPAKALMREHVVQMTRAITLKGSKKLAFNLTGKIRTGLWGRDVELMRLRQAVAHVANPVFSPLKSKRSNRPEPAATGFSSRRGLEAINLLDC